MVSLGIYTPSVRAVDSDSDSGTRTRSDSVVFAGLGLGLGLGSIFHRVHRVQPSFVENNCVVGNTLIPVTTVTVLLFSTMAAASGFLGTEHGNKDAPHHYTTPDQTR